MDRLDTIVKKLEYYDAGKVVLMPPHEDIVFLIRAAKALRGIVQWTDACWNGGYCGDPKAPHPAWEDVQEGRAALAAYDKEG